MRAPRAIDDKDRAILRVLQRRGDAPVGEIAKAAGLSPTPCWRRVGRLEKSGVIRARVALLDAGALGHGVVVLADVAVKDHKPKSRAAFEQAVRAMPEIVECHAMSGEHDYALKILCAGVPAYETLLRERLLRLPGVATIRSRFVLAAVKQTTEIPI